MNNLTWKRLVFVDVDVVVGVFVFGRATKTNTHSHSPCFLLLLWCSTAPQPLSATQHILLISFSSSFCALSGAEYDLSPNAVMEDSRQHCFPCFDSGFPQHLIFRAFFLFTFNFVFVFIFFNSILFPFWNSADF